MVKYLKLEDINPTNICVYNMDLHGKTEPMIKLRDLAMIPATTIPDSNDSNVLNALPVLEDLGPGVIIKGFKMPSGDEPKTFITFFNDDGTAEMVAVGHPELRYDVKGFDIDLTGSKIDQAVERVGKK